MIYFFFYLNNNNNNEKNFKIIRYNILLPREVRSTDPRAQHLMREVFCQRRSVFIRQEWRFAEELEPSALF